MPPSNASFLDASPAQVSVEVARQYLRLSAPKAAQVQLGEILKSDRLSSGPWLEAALMEGLLDAMDPAEVMIDQEAKGTTEPLGTLNEMHKVLLSFLSNLAPPQPSAFPGLSHGVVGMPGIPFGNCPSERLDVSYQFCAFRPAVPDGFARFLRAWSERLLEQQGRCEEEYGAVEPNSRSDWQHKRYCAYRSFVDTAAAICLLALATDDVELYARWWNDPRVRGFVHTGPKLPAEWVVGKKMIDGEGGELWLHHGMAAMNYGAHRCLSFLLDQQWDPSADAVIGVHLDGRPGTPKCAPKLLGEGIRLSPACVATLLDAMAERGLTQEDKKIISNFSGRLISLWDDPSCQEAADALVACGLVRHVPRSISIWGLHNRSARLLDLVGERVDWTHLVHEGSEHDGFATGHEGVAWNLVRDETSGRGQETLCWLIQHLAAKPEYQSELQGLFNYVANDVSLVHQVVRYERKQVLVKMLEHGLDPQHRPLYAPIPDDLGESVGQPRQAKSALEAAVELGCEEMERIIRSHLARNAARDVVAELAAGLQPG